MAARPSLELTVEVTAADGTQRRWGAGGRAGDIPQGLSFRTKQAEGFADASLSLARRIDREYVDLHLLDGIVISGAAGDIAYEGRVAALPRSMQDTHQVTVQAAGWMAHARDRKLSEVIVDRDLGAWGAISRTRRATLLAGNWRDPQDASVQQDATNALPSLTLGFTDGWTSPFQPVAEGVYDAGPGLRIGRIYYDRAVTSTVNFADANWNLRVLTVTDDTGNTVGDNFDLRTGAAAGYLVATSPQRYVIAQLYYNATPAGAADTTYEATLRKLTAYGDQGLPLIGDTDPKGVAASDVIKYIAGKYCPQLNTAGVQQTTYPIPHAVFRDRVDPYDAFLDVNKYHLWQLAVWDHRTLTYGPVDLSDYDWEIRLSDPGTKVDLQGDSSDSLANGIVVEYDDVATGSRNVLTPDAFAELRDSDPGNPYNQAGYPGWHEITLSAPTDQPSAVQIGRGALAEFNQPKGPGTISVQGHIRDRAGHWQPVWKVRAGDRIVISDHPNDRARRVVETDYQHDPKTVSIAVDQTFKRVDAVLDRFGTALRAANLLN